MGLQWFDMTNNLTVSDYLNFYIPPKKDYNLSFPQNTLSIINPVKDILPKPSLYFIDERIIDELKIQEIPLPSVPCKLDALLSFALLGIDIKITPEGEVKIIEVNGIHSGMGRLASKEMAENELNRNYTGKVLYEVKRDGVILNTVREHEKTKF